MRRLSGICIITRDVRRLSDFYRDVLEAEPEGDDTYAALTSHGIVLSFCIDRLMEQMAPGSMQCIGQGTHTLEFEVEDVDREYERLTRMGTPIIKPPTTQPWGIRSVWFRDPDGNIVNFLAAVPSP